MKKNFKQAVSACLVSLLVMQSSYGLIPALADAADAVSTTSEIVQGQAGGARATGSTATSSTPSTSSNWTDNDASAAVSAVSFAQTSVKANAGEDLSLAGAVTLASNSDATCWKDGTNEQRAGLFQIDDSGLFNGNGTLTVAADGNFTVSGTIESDTSGDFDVLISLASNQAISSTVTVNVTEEIEIPSVEISFEQDSLTLTAGGENGTNTLVIVSPADLSESEILAGLTYESSNETVATVAGNHTATVTVTPVSEGEATITAKCDILNETQYPSFTVIVKGPIESGSAEVESLISADQVNIPEKPADMSEEAYTEFTADAGAAAQTAIDSIINNAAVQEDGTTSGFDNIANLSDYTLPSADTVTIYPNQKLTDMEIGREASTTQDENGNTVTVYTPIISRIVFDIKVYAKAADDAEEGIPLPGAQGTFRFRIPIPVGISASANYAVMKHTGDDGTVIDNNKYYEIQGSGTSKYIDVTVNHFSEFELTFSEMGPDNPSNPSNPSNPGSTGSHGGSGGGGGGGSSRSTASASGSWVLSEKGWWYRYADNTYPHGAWANLAYGTVGYRWYHFDAEGYMQTGWFTDADGHRYYLHPVSDGTQGHMYTGWHEIDGSWYYFSETKTDANPTGSLLVNTTTPDGHTVNGNGVRIQ